MDQRDPRFVATIYGRNRRFTAWESVMVQRTFGDPVSTFQFPAAEGYYGDRMTTSYLRCEEPTRSASARRPITPAVPPAPPEVPGALDGSSRTASASDPDDPHLRMARSTDATRPAFFPS